MTHRRNALFALVASFTLAAPAPLIAETHSVDIEQLELSTQPWLKDWLHLPDWVQFSINYTTEINANPLGGDQQTGTYTHNLAINSAFSSGFGKDESDWDELDHWTLAVTASQRSGTSLSHKIPNQLAVQQIYGYGQTFRLAGLWLERNQSDDGLLKLKLGKFATFDDFASSPLYCYYTNNGFCGQNWGIPNSLPVLAYPSNQYGVVFHLGSADGPRVRAGTYQINPDGAVPGYHGTDFSIRPGDGLAQFVQLDVPFSPLAPLPARRLESGAIELVADEERELNYVSGLPQAGLQLGGWVGFWEFPELNGGGRTSQNNKGLYGLVSVPADAGGLALDGRVWVNATYGLTQSVQDVPNSLAGGWIGKGVFRRRPHDALVVGIANANWSRDIVDGPIWETALELGYQVSLGGNASVQPSVQYIFNPMGKGEVDDPLVLGLQVSLTL